MEEIKYTIYKLIDPTDDNIRYIGLTFNDLKLRLKSHLSEPGKSHKIYWINKLKKQGLKPIIESVEENISTHEIACEREIYYIEYFKSIGCDLTNMATGGNKNKKMSDETKKKMSESQKERYKYFKITLSDCTKKKMSVSTKERFENLQEREKLRISNKRYENSKSTEQRLNDILIQNPKKIYQYDKDMILISEYPSIRDAERKTELSRGNISKCCKHKVTYVGGYVWRFEGDLTPPEYKNRKEVIQYDMEMNYINEFENIRKSYIETGVNESRIRGCCKGKYKSAGGFIWKYKNNI
jgi:group I intron endonuclease